jgi:hypothetical protein
MGSLLEVLRSSPSLSISARPTTRVDLMFGRKIECKNVERGEAVLDAKCSIATRTTILPGPAANDFTPNDPILPDHSSTPHSTHILLILALFQLCLALSLFQQEMYPSSRMFFSTRPTSTFDIRPD